MKHSGMLIGVVLGSLVLLACLAGSAAALVPDGTHGWFWQMPQPAGGRPLSRWATGQLVPSLKQRYLPGVNYPELRVAVLVVAIG